MSWFKDKKEEEIDDDFNYDPSNPYTSKIEEEFTEVNIKDLINANKLNNESELPTEY